VNRQRANPEPACRTRQARSNPPAEEIPQIAQFLIATTLQLELPVTHTKQTTGAFLIATNRTCSPRRALFRLCARRGAKAEPSRSWRAPEEKGRGEARAVLTDGIGPINPIGPYKNEKPTLRVNRSEWGTRGREQGDYSGAMWLDGMMRSRQTNEGADRVGHPLHQGKKRASSKGLLPPELARRISPYIVNSGEMAGAVGKNALIGAMLLSLYGPEHNGFLCLLGPWICPTLIALFWSTLFARRRFRIYRGSPFAEHSYVDTGGDPVVMRLSEIFNSSEARRHLWRESLKVSAILFAVLGTAVLLLRNSFNWVYPSPGNQFFWTARRGVPGYWFWLGLVCCLLFAFLALVSDFYRWCLTTWVKREQESAHPAGARS